EALPDHVADLKSTHDGQLKAVFQRNKDDTRAAVSRIENTYRALRIADAAITAIEIASLLGTIKGAVGKIVVKELAAGATAYAARSAAIRFAVKQLLVNAAVAYGAAQIVPRVLVTAGLNEDEIRAGL